MKHTRGELKLSEFQVADWGRHGWGKELQAEAAEQIGKHATYDKELGGWFMNFDEWDDLAQASRFQAFLKGYTESKIVSANPAVMVKGATDDGLTSVLTQYLSYPYAFIDRVFKPGMDQGSFESAKYAIKLSSLTYASEYFRAIANGKDLDDITWTDVGVRAIQQFQIFPFSFAPLLNRGLEAGGFSLPEVLGTQDIRFQDRTGVPLIGAMNQAARPIKEILTGNASKATLSNLQMFMPGVQASYAHILRDQVAEFGADVFDLPEKSMQIIKKDK